MKKTIKKIIKEIVPPILWKSLKLAKQFLSAKQSYIEWEYMPNGWETAKTDPNIKGWDVESVLEAYKSNWSNFLKTIEGTLPLGLSPESSEEERFNPTFHNLMMSYGYAIALASREKSSISILDWGGAIGHYYLISQRLLPDVAINYHCKDVTVLAKYGTELFPEASFYDNETCLGQHYDFVFASGSLQYSQDWRYTLNKLADSTSEYIFITRLPIVQNTSSFVMVQRPYQYGYDTEYLGWCFNKYEFLDTAKSIGLFLVREFFAQESSLIHNAPEQPIYYGFLFKRA